MPISRSLCARVTFPKNRSNAHPPATHHSERTADNKTTLSSGVGAPQDSWLGRSTAGIQPSPVRVRGKCASEHLAFSAAHKIQIEDSIFPLSIFVHFSVK